MFNIPLLGICAQSSGMGKTTLIEAVLPMLTARGLKVSVIKQTHAEFDLDQPNKDSYRLRGAGAAQVLLSSQNRWALLSEQKSHGEDDRVLEMVRHLDPHLADMVLVEGFRHAPIPKIEVFRPSCGKTLLAQQDAHIIAIASDFPVASTRPVLNLNSPAVVAEFIADWWGRHQGHAMKRFFNEEAL